MTRSMRDVGVDAAAEAWFDDPVSVEGTAPAEECRYERLQSTGASVIRLGDVEPEVVRWMWPGRMPFGKLTMLDGDPGVGKSTLALDIAARVTTGGVMPGCGVDGRRQPAAVVLLSAEDGVADTIRPRVDAAGGDPDLVYVVEAVRGESPDSLTELSLPVHVEQVRAVVDEVGAVLVIIDVLNAYLHTTLDVHKDQAVRAGLRPLADMAAATGAAVLALRHLNKSGGPKALYRGGGSIGIAGAARSVLVAGDHPDDAGLRVLASVKSNLAERPPALGYRLVPVDEHGCSRIEWAGAVDLDADALMGGSDDVPAREVDEFLRAELAEGAVPAKEMLRRGREAGFSDKQLNSAKKRVGVLSSRQGFAGDGSWSWRLSDDQPS
ncbi:MAG: AAA family ATPase [Acidimicrobiales bacterium]